MKVVTLLFDVEDSSMNVLFQFRYDAINCLRSASKLADYIIVRAISAQALQPCESS